MLIQILTKLKAERLGSRKIFAAIRIKMDFKTTNFLMCSNLGRRRRMWLLDEVPQAPLVLCKLAGAKVLLHLLLDVGCLLLHLVLDELLAGVELVLTTGL